MHKQGQVQAVICDPYQLHSLIVEWEKAGIRVIELPQSSGRVEADQALYDAVIARSIRHYNDPELNRHVQNTVAIETPRGFRIAKEKTSQKIDAAVALSMALHGSLDQQKSGRYEAKAVPNPFYEYNDSDIYGRSTMNESLFGPTIMDIAAWQRDQAKENRLQNSVNLFWKSVKKHMENQDE